MYSLAERHECELVVNRPDEDVIAEVDARRVERILRNLVGNAIEHGAGQPVEITLAANRTAAAVTVRDLGVGLSSAEAQHVFDRFWRADPSRVRTVGGSGPRPVHQPRGRPAARRLAAGVGAARRRSPVPAHPAAGRRRRPDRLTAAAAPHRPAPAPPRDAVVTRGRGARAVLAALVALLPAPGGLLDGADGARRRCRSPQAPQRPAEDVGIEPQPPEAGATPEEIVRGFIEAAASTLAGHPVARQHLTAQAAESWSDESGITVISPELRRRHRRRGLGHRHRRPGGDDRPARHLRRGRDRRVHAASSASRRSTGSGGSATRPTG